MIARVRFGNSPTCVVVVRAARYTVGCFKRWGFHSIDKEVPIGQETVEGVQAESEGAVVKFFKQLGRSFALQYFGEPRFLLTLSAAFVIGLGGHFMPFIPQQARLVGVEATSTARLSFYVAIGDLSARIIYGILASRSPFPRTVEFTAAVSICAIVAVVISFAPAMGYLIALSLIGGLGSGVVVISLPLVLSSNHGADMMSGTFNLVRLFQGVAKIIYPAIAGALRTNHGATAMMYFAASLMCTGAVLGFVLHFVCLLVNKRKREAEGTTV